MSADPFGGRPIVTVPEAATWLGWSRSVTYEAARQGLLPTLRRGRYLFVPVAALLALVGLTPDQLQPPVTRS